MELSLKYLWASWARPLQYTKNAVVGADDFVYPFMTHNKTTVQQRFNNRSKTSKDFNKLQINYST